MSEKLPAYRRVLAELRDLILSGQLAEGDRLPTVREISERYGVPTGTASQAVSQLQAEGFVVKRHGSGAFVRRFQTIPRSSPSRLSRARWSAGGEIQQVDTGQRSRSVDVVIGEVDAPEWVAEPLGLAAGQRVIYRSRRFIVDERPVQLATSYFAVEVARGTAIMHTDTGPGGVYARLAEQGCAPATFTEYLRARMPLPDESDKLELPGGTPVVEITRHAIDGGGRCVEVNRMILDGSVYLLDYTFPADSPTS